MPGSSHDDSMKNENVQFEKSVFSLSKLDIIHYEIARAWWPQFVSAKWAQRLCSRYFAWKAERIFARFNAMREMFERVAARQEMKNDRMD